MEKHVGLDTNLNYSYIGLIEADLEIFSFDNKLIYQVI